METISLWRGLQIILHSQKEALLTTRSRRKFEIHKFFLYPEKEGRMMVQQGLIAVLCVWMMVQQGLIAVLCVQVGGRMMVQQGLIALLCVQGTFGKAI